MEWLWNLKCYRTLDRFGIKLKWLVTSKKILSYKRTNRLRRKLQKVERQILKITGKNPERTQTWVRSQKQLERVCKLISERCYLLNRLFVATPAEVERMEQVNALLQNSTKTMYHCCAELYRQLLKQSWNENFDDDIYIKGTLWFSCNDRLSVLDLENDIYYGSDFYRMLSVIDWIYHSEYSDFGFGLKEFESCEVSIDRTNTPGMTDQELGFDNWADDGTTWAEGPLRHPAFKHICICHAIHDACTHHQGYSIPDLLRMNDFQCKVTVECEHSIAQDGRRADWWRCDCSFNGFRDKFLSDAIHRPSEWRLGQFIFNQALAIFPKEAESLRGGVHDCFYDDEKVDDYLRNIFGLLQNNPYFCKHKP